jgi:hypothetical protein
MSKSKNPALIAEIAQHFEESGIYKCSSDAIRKRLLDNLPKDQVPTSLVIRNIMKDTFKLKYKTLEKANTKYRDPDYNEKRLWVCRLLS